MKKNKLKGWHFWLAYVILMTALLILLNGCAVTRPAEMRFAKGLKVEKHTPIKVVNCNRE